MADNYLITGYWGEPHVTAENDRGINAAIFGTGKFVLPVGEQFRAEYIGNNTIRMYDGKLLDNGAAAGIPAGKYVDLLISEAGQGKKRNDLIVFQYSQDSSTLIESGVFIVLKGTETSGTATDPALTEDDLLSDEATIDQMALWRVSVSGAVISSPVKLFSVSKNMQNVDEPKVAATSTDGVNYTAEVNGLEELSVSYGLTIIPDIDSASTTPTLNVNGLGAKTIRRRASNSTATTVASSNEGWLGEGKPIRLMYDGTYWIADFDRPNANDLYGTVAVAKGGTGATTAEGARANIGAVAMNTRRVTLAAADWVDNAQTVNIEGVTEDEETCHVFVTHAPESYSDYTVSGVHVTAQANGSLEFACDFTPTDDISVNVAIFTT